MSSNIAKNSSTEELQIKEIPGGYGLPFFGAISDRLDFHYRQGPDEFFRDRMQKHNSTVFRANAPPGPFNARNTKVVVLLDAVSFPILFDTSKVEKRDVFTGTFMPSTSFTGGYRVCSYLDPSEPKHALIKGFLLSLLGRLHKELIPTFQAAVSQLFADVEADLDAKGESAFNPVSDKMSFDLLFRLFSGKSSYDTGVGKGNSSLNTWLLLQLAPLVTLGLKFVPNFIEDLVLHTFPLPYFLAKSGYEKVHKAFQEEARELLDEAEKKGLSRDEASHNLMFVMGFNSYGGTKILFPALLKYVGGGGEDLHRRIAVEIRGVVEEEGGVTLAALEKMSLVKSVVWETMRIEPPVQFQYGKAKEDLKISSHVATYVVKKGEMIFGYQPFATRDPLTFVNPDEFVPERFMDDGEKLIKYVYWSNGRETDNPTADNKQCPAKDMVVLLGRMMLVEIFMRYDTFTVEVGKLLLGSSVTIKSMTKFI
ncbi:allene oxide synthase 3-like [Salvia hispanica]|uniref:allene oxide synthase 3-like n=1 Tax=Salvia hispanica TaxID=49212 RepID=UPI0020099898|nr:allene oxide synthase 3-like [Salvia hispanica]